MRRDLWTLKLRRAQREEVCPGSLEGIPGTGDNSLGRLGQTPRQHQYPMPAALAGFDHEQAFQTVETAPLMHLHLTHADRLPQEGTRQQDAA